MEEKKGIQLIHVQSILKAKNPALARLLPGFVTRYISRIIHEEEINEILSAYGDKFDLDFLDAVIRYFNVTLIVKGAENLPAEGRFIFSGNHPLGGFDGILLMHYLGGRYPAIRFLVNDILMNIKNIEGLFIPINKHGAHSKEAARSIDEVLTSNKQVLTFPAGLVSRKIKGQIVDLEWKKSFIQKSVKYQRDIIPFYVEGHNTRWFYSLAKMRKFLGLKWNIEMFYLPDETFRHKNKTFTIHFGAPIPYQTFDHSKNNDEWANWVKKIVYSLSKPEKR
jgi:putative hemolysin